MEIHYCWRCQKDMPFLDDSEYESLKPHLRLPVMIDSRYCHLDPKDIIPNYAKKKFTEMTGFDIESWEVIFHHKRSDWGEPCRHCDHLLRSPRATYCANCGKDT